MTSGDLIGSIPDWIAAVAGTGALLFAGIAAVAAWRAYKIQQAELSSLLDDRRREQASRVTAWRVITEDGERVYRVRNASELPVTNLVLYEDEDGPRVTRRAFPPGTEDIPVSPLDIHATGGELPRLSFRDASGQQWCRQSNGKLVAYDRLKEYTRLYGKNRDAWPEYERLVMWAEEEGQEEDPTPLR